MKKGEDFVSNYLDQSAYDELLKSSKVAAASQMFFALGCCIYLFERYQMDWQFMSPILGILVLSTMRILCFVYHHRISRQLWKSIFSFLLFSTSLVWVDLFLYTSHLARTDFTLIPLSILGPVGLFGASFLSISISKRDSLLFQSPLLLGLLASLYILYGSSSTFYLCGFAIGIFWVYTLRGKKAWHDTWSNLKIFNYELQTVIDSIPGGISVVHDGRYVQLNSYFTGALNINRNEFINQPVDKLFPNSNFTKHLREFSESTQVKAQFEFMIPTQAGDRTHYVIFKRFSIPGFKDQIVISAVDIEDLKEAHVEIERQKHQIEYSAKMASLGEMSSGIAHEINNPLAVISARAQILQQEITLGNFTPEKGLKASDAIINMSVRISKIIRALKLFARDSSKDKFEISNLNQIILETISLCEARSTAHAVSIKQTGLVDDVYIECSPTQISQVLLNALNNSFDAVATLDEKWIRVDCFVEAGHVQIEVVDSGHGIPPAIKDEVMKPFFTTKAAGHGTGLGLSLSKGIIDSHKGQMYFDHESPNTKLVLILPRNQSASQVRLTG